MGCNSKLHECNPCWLPNRGNAGENQWKEWNTRVMQTYKFIEHAMDPFVSQLLILWKLTACQPMSIWHIAKANGCVWNALASKSKPVSAHQHLHFQWFTGNIGWWKLSHCWKLKYGSLGKWPLWASYKCQLTGPKARNLNESGLNWSKVDKWSPDGPNAMWTLPGPGDSSNTLFVWITGVEFVMSSESDHELANLEPAAYATCWLNLASSSQPKNARRTASPTCSWPYTCIVANPWMAGNLRTPVNPRVPNNPRMLVDQLCHATQACQPTE